MSSKYVKLLIAAAICIFIGTVIYMAVAYDKVQGTDDKIGVVVKDYAAKVGVSERPPLINTDKGDILLFLFGFGGLVSGFYLGYSWRKIVSEKPLNIEKMDTEGSLPSDDDGKEGF